MRQIVQGRASCSPGAWSPTSEARAELAAEPYKLELIGLKGGGADAEESVEVGGSELTIYDNLDASSGERCGRTCAGARTCRPPGRSRPSS